MIGKLLRGAGRRHGVRLSFAFCALSSFVTAILATVPAAAQSPSYFNKGIRWIGIRTTSTCTAPRAPTSWTAEPLFASSTLPAGLAQLCLYAWSPVPARDPTSTEVQDLFNARVAQDLTEDVPVVFPSAPFSTQEVAFFTGLRTALRAQVGDASLLPHVPASPAVRVVVIDSAPDAPRGQIHPGASRHGDTLAHLIEDLVCLPAAGGLAGTCAAEVTTALALPRLTGTGAVEPHGGYVGTLSDLARAIERAVSTWQNDLRNAPSSTPARLVLNLSLGWEDTPGIADCSTGSPAGMGPPARAVRGILQHAAAQGAPIVAAAGNDSGGPVPRSGLVCPGRYQAVPQDANASRSLVVAASGVDYHDHPLETARPLGITGIVGLGLGGVAWDPADPVPPPLTGSSVSTAVVSAVSALVWAQQPSWTPAEVTRAVYAGGVDLRTATHECPLLLPSCTSHRVSVCGALQAAGASPSCSPAAPRDGSYPSLPGESAALGAAFASLPPTAGTTAPTSPSAVPRALIPTPQILPWTFPQPISDSCPTCAVDAQYLSIPPREESLLDPVLVVRFADETTAALALGPPSTPPSASATLESTTPYLFSLPSGWGPIQSAYITAFDAQQQYSITEQIFVQQ
jgi:hypothetical protein